MKHVNLGIVGATGLVGRTFLKVLEERNFPIQNLYLFSSKKSAGSNITFKENIYCVEELKEDSFDRPIDILLFSAGGEISKKYAPLAQQRGILVIDNSSAWRMDPEVPLIVPEVNPQDLLSHNYIIANPNCSTIQAVVALGPLHERFKIKRVVFSTYQAVSGSGVKGIEDLEKGIQEQSSPSFYPHPIAYNCLPHIDVFLPNGYSKEEMKMINETKKILNDYSLQITSTTVRVPVLHCHSESINIEFEKPFTLEAVVEVLKNSPGIVIQDDPTHNVYPLPLALAGKDEVYVGRIRRDESIENGLNLWVVADNIRKGAATNTVQIAELALKELF